MTATVRPTELHAVERDENGQIIGIRKPVPPGAPVLNEVYEAGFADGADRAWEQARKLLGQAAADTRKRLEQELPAYGIDRWQAGWDAGYEQAVEDARR